MGTLATPVQPPLAARRPTRIEKHGDVRVDEFFWLRERDNPAVLAYLEAENAFTETVMAHTRDLQTRVYDEMRTRIRETDQSAPLPEGAYLYYTRTEAGKNYPIHCRRQMGSGAPEEVLLDVNALAEGHAFCAIGAWRVSPDQRLLAYALDVGGDERFTIYVKDLTSGELLPDRIDGVYYGLEWANDGRTLFYTTLDAAHRPHKLWRHTLGDGAEDTLVFHEPDASYFLGVSKTRSRQFILITLESNTVHEVWFLPAATPAAAPRLIEPRAPGHEYTVDHRDDHFYIRSNAGAANFHILTAPVAAPGKAQWQALVPHDPAVLVERIDLFADHLVYWAHKDGLPAVRVLRLETGRPAVSEAHWVAFPEPLYACHGAENRVFETGDLYIEYSSLRTPATIYRYDMAGRVLHVVKRDEIAGYDPEQYVMARIWATAADGAAIPVSVVHHKRVALNGNNPTWLTGYGSYGSSSDPHFVPHHLSLLERGFVFALAHVRGGSEMGRSWYEHGKMLHKRNTFTDFIACAEALIGAGYTRPGMLVTSGRSAGGLLMGAVTNLRPDLFAAVIAGVPFMDVINTMLDPTIPLTVNEYDEWGNPEHPEQYVYMRSYSPYDNLVVRAYPAMLVTAGLNDPRVQYWEPAKYVARLRTLNTGTAPVLLKTNMAAGHGGASGRYDHLREIAFEYAFFLDTLGAYA
jgi:oligopeptidase B